MSYSPLPDNETVSDPDQLPALLEKFEGYVSRIYNDGKGNPTIGIGLNIAVSSNMAVVLYQIAPTLFANLTAAETEALVTSFETIVRDNPLPINGPNDSNSANPDSATEGLIDALNKQLANDLKVSVGSLTSSFGPLSTSFSLSQAQTALADALSGTGVPNYTFTGYNAKLETELTGVSNLPPPNSEAWAALLSLYFNRSSLIGPRLIAALNEGNLA